MRNKLALLVAVALGLIAVYGIHRHLANVKDETRSKYKTIQVAVAAEEIRIGETIEPNMIGYKEIPETAIIAGQLDQSSVRSIIGQRIRKHVERGDPLLSSYFGKKVQSLRDRLKEGERALTLRVDLVSGVAGNIVPGSYVDILGTFAVRKKSGRQSTEEDRESETLVILNNVLVLAVDNRTQAGEFVTLGSGQRTSYSTVTVAVKQHEVPVLVHGQHAGSLTLVLRQRSETAAGSAPDPVNNLNLIERAAQIREARLREEAARKARGEIPGLGTRVE